MAVNLRPDLRVLFPDVRAAETFARRCRDCLEIAAERDDCVVTIPGAAVEHPALRADLIAAAAFIGGDEVPATGSIN